MYEFETHDGTIKTDETCPGYVWMRCDRWSLPDNTQGQIGWHVFYRPLAGHVYIGNELVTGRVAEAIREHYAARDLKRAQQRAAAEEALRARQPESRTPDHVQRLAEKYGDSVAAWEAGDEAAWAQLRQHGY